MKKSEDEPEEVGRAPDPGFDVDRGEVLRPLDKIDEVSNLLNLPVYDLIDIESQSDTNHECDRDIACYSILDVDEDEDKGEDKNLHVIL